MHLGCRYHWKTSKCSKIRCTMQAVLGKLLTMAFNRSLRTKILKYYTNSRYIRTSIKRSPSRCNQEQQLLSFQHKLSKWYLILNLNRKKVPSNTYTLSKTPHRMLIISQVPILKLRSMLKCQKLSNLTQKNSLDNIRFKHKRLFCKLTQIPTHRSTRRIYPGGISMKSRSRMSTK